MGSPITFSGFNRIDWNVVLDAVMAQERQPIARLETRKRTLEAQDTAFGTLAGKLTTLESALDTLKATDSLSVLTATSSDTGVGVSTTTGTIEGTYSVVVSELAKTQVLTSTSTYAALTTEVATGGAITITPTTGSPVTITVTASTSLQGLVNAINADTNSPVSATAVESAPGQFRLMLAGKTTGVSNGFTVTKTLSGGAGVTFTDTDSDGTYGDSAADNTQNALDAALTVNGLSITSASNTITGVVPGATLTLNAKDAAKTITIGVTRNVTEAKARLNKFITAYNDLVTFAKDQNTAAVAGRASIARTPVLRGFFDSMRTALLDDYTPGTYTRLGAVGVGFDRTGKMTLDETVFDAAMKAAPTAVQALFSTTETTGAFGKLASIAEDYNETGGLVATVRQQLTDQVSTLSNRLVALESQLAVRRRALQQQYIAADLAMTRLNSQSASLSSLGAQYRLF
jgi:flagellar hook-associated protein 2